MPATYLRSARGLSSLARRAFTTTARQLEEKAVAPTSTETPVPKLHSQTPAEVPQAPNRKEIWSRSQRPRNVAMTGPRFEQTDFDLQVRCEAQAPLPSSRRHVQMRGWANGRIEEVKTGLLTSYLSAPNIAPAVRRH